MTNGETIDRLENGLIAEVIDEAEADGVDVANGYQITTIIPYAEKPSVKEEYTVPAGALDGFFHDYADTAEIVVDVRPADALEVRADG